MVITTLICDRAGCKSEATYFRRPGTTTWYLCGQMRNDARQQDSTHACSADHAMEIDCDLAKLGDKH